MLFLHKSLWIIYKLIILGKFSHAVGSSSKPERTNLLNLTQKMCFNMNYIVRTCYSYYVLHFFFKVPQLFLCRSHFLLHCAALALIWGLFSYLSFILRCGLVVCDVNSFWCFCHLWWIDHVRYFCTQRTYSGHSLLVIRKWQLDNLIEQYLWSGASLVDWLWCKVASTAFTISCKSPRLFMIVLPQ